MIHRLFAALLGAFYSLTVTVCRQLSFYEIFMKKLTEKKAKNNKKTNTEKLPKSKAKKKSAHWEGVARVGVLTNLAFSQLSWVHAAPRGNARLMNFLTFDLDFLSQTHWLCEPTEKPEPK